MMRRVLRELENRMNEYIDDKTEATRKEQLRMTI